MTAKINLQDILDANRVGLEHEGRWDLKFYYSPILNVAQNAGIAGIDLSQRPVVTGYRYGDVPRCGLSYNWADDRSEFGLSLVKLDSDAREVGSSIFFRDRGLVEVTGVLLDRTGSDGEPLVLPINVVDNWD